MKPSEAPIVAPIAGSTGSVPAERAKAITTGTTMLAEAVLLVVSERSVASAVENTRSPKPSRTPRSVVRPRPSASASPVRKASVPSAIDDRRLDETFAALASSTRREILGRLATGAATVNEIAEPFAMTLPAISKHLKVLERAGLITRGQHAQYRPCALDAAPLEAVSTWAEQYRPIWEARFDRMRDYLAQLQSEEKG